MEAAKPIEGEKVWRWEWLLAAPPEKVWPYVSDTQRVGRAIGFGPWHFKETADARGGSTRQGTVSFLGVVVEWDELPYEWVAPREMGVVRRYTRGPFAVIRQHVVLEPHQGGTKLVHLIAVKSHGMLGSLTAGYEVGKKTFVGLDKVYRGFDDYLKGVAEASFPREPVVLTEAAPRLLEKARGELGALGFEAPLVQRLVETIEKDGDRDVARLRPFALAKRWSASPMDALKLFLHATKQGILELSWDLVCPSCKGAKETTQDLAQLRNAVHCGACNVSFDANFDASVEVTFRPSAAVRPIEGGDYCVGGPGNTRHLVAQRRILPGETAEISLSLEPGLYRLRGPRNPGEVALDAREGGASELALATGKFPEQATIAPLAVLRVKNEADFEHAVSLERLAWKEDVATGTVVTCLQEFRDLFSSQVFSPDAKIGVSSISLLFTDLKSSTAMYEKVGDAVAFALVRDHFKLLFESVSAEQGGLVKTIGDAVMASFPEPAHALRAALRMHEQIAEFNEHEKPAFPVRLKIGLHAGPCIAVNLNERIDYFGTTVNMAARIQNESMGDDVVLLDSLARDPEVAKVLDAASGRREEFEAELKGLSGRFKLLRFYPARGTAAQFQGQRISTRFKQTNLFGTSSSAPVLRGGAPER